MWRLDRVLEGTTYIFRRESDGMKALVDIADFWGGELGALIRRARAVEW